LVVNKIKENHWYQKKYDLKSIYNNGNEFEISPGNLKGAFPVKNELDDFSPSSIPTSTENNFGSALANMNSGDVIEFAGNDDYEYMFNGELPINFVSALFLSSIFIFLN